MLALEVSNLSLSLGKRRLITRLNWQVQAGEMWCVLGRNGAGKSTLLHALSGLQAIDCGEIRIMGRPIDTLSLTELAQVRGLMPQHINDRFSCSVGDAVAIARTPWRFSASVCEDEVQILVSDALAQVDMLNRMDDDITQLSGGERQRVALAALLAQNPLLMLLDEPTSHQDMAQQLLVMRLMRQRSADHAVIASCHDIHLAARFATHCLLLGEGFYDAGPVSEMLNAQRLSRVFGCEFDHLPEVMAAV